MELVTKTEHFSSNKAQYFLNDYYRALTDSPARFYSVPDSIETLKEIRLIEDDWMTCEEGKISEEILPSNNGEFLDWYRKKLKLLNKNISGFLDYIENEAPASAIAYYVCMEELVDGSFDDIMALAQLGVHNESKMAIAENYWDEMGKGQFSQIHTEMFSESSSYCKKMLADLALKLPNEIPTECLMNGNLVTFWSLRRKFIPRLYGAIGLIEGSAPLRFRAVTKGMERCGFPESAIAYHREHIQIDAVHGKEWLHRVLIPHIENDERICQEIARGVLIRFSIAENYYTSVEAIVRDRCT
ncbi:iron-containing redox enzyme family protein [Reinekea sp.]|jgi:hypothetical protein|uniref:iron-containing redox enzyme family protein n=1 Tax=Reinekea sp. TaxID=1970455 RepID=UPI002A7F6D79|nr:iron-containing redox enzyme family protein [Reinekea sp.]